MLGHILSIMEDLMLIRVTRFTNAYPQAWLG